MSNLEAFESMIAQCEGTGDCYNALFGYRPGNNRVFDNDYATHPRIAFPFTDTKGNKQESTAAGRYQIIYPTFVRLQAKLGTTDFSPATQDAMAAELIAEAGAMADVKDGNLGDALDKCAHVWASLPSSTYDQPVRTMAFAVGAYQDAGGVLA